jgi:magnesium transporter
MIVDCAHYKDGKRQEQDSITLEEAASCALDDDKGWIWLGLFEPDEKEMHTVSEHFHLHELAVEDASKFHQRPKMEDYGEAFFFVLHTAKYDEESEVVEFGEIHLFLGPGYVITVRRGEATELGRARKQLEARDDLLCAGPVAVVWSVLDKVVDDYRPVVDGIEDDISEVEEQVFAGGGDQTRRVYLLKREVVEFYRAVHPLLEPLSLLEGTSEPFDRIPSEVKPFFRDVNDHVKRVNEEVMTMREMLNSILQANMATVAVQQNEVVRQVSGWAAIITVPTFIASVYGMNFRHMPELNWYLGYPFAIALMIIAASSLYFYFKRVDWL